ncbi:MAG: hypothetical protein AAF721_06085 [Myxococcota bacterium]
MRISSLLRRLYSPAPKADPAVRDALEAKLLAGMRPASSNRRRWLVGLTIGGAVLAGACVAPTDYEVSVGHRIVLTWDSGEPDLDPEALARHVEESFELDEMRVMVAMSRREGDAEPVSELRVAMDLVGKPNIAEIEASMFEHFPALADADIDVERLDGTVHGTLGGMLSERALGLHLDRASVEETRARILAELAARGLQGEATIEIEDEHTATGHRREVRVRVEADKAPEDL